MTNFERIKNMTIEEMAELIVNRADCSGCPLFAPNLQLRLCRQYDNCVDPTKKWLESEADANETD